MPKGLIVTTKQKYETEIAKRTMEACEQISIEMGAEVHDDLIQKLTVFTLNIDRLERSIGNPPEAESLIMKMRNDFQEMVSSVRSISRKLMPVSMEGEKFTRSIELLCENLELPSQGLIHFSSSGHEIDLSVVTRRYLYRILQELIHNAFKNSSAWHVWVKLIWTDDQLLLEVEDDGTAFSNMQEQITRLESKYNTLKMRSQAINAVLSYHQGKKGLLARVKYKI
ncbi:MAG: hypothetical protein HY015_07790 [Bacteroidetes bacterium]|nr:hypothetical protein [Bacteroidota bacterium]